MSKPILHAEFLKALLNGEQIEMRLRSNPSNHWFSFCSGNCPLDMFHDPNYDVRIKPKTILINGIEVPEPFRGELHLDQDYFVVKLHRSKKADPFVNGNPELGMRHVATGLVHLTEEAAETHACALLSFTAKE